MKVVLENFQSIEHGELEFPEGITIIQGKNGSGKTAVFRAIKGLLTNPSGTAGYIRHGAKEARVTLQNNDNDVTWIRTSSSCAYIDNLSGKVYSKAGKLDSEDIADLGFYFDNRGRVVNIHDEWSVLFPFGESDADMFKLFEDVFNISCSSAVIDELKKDEQQYKSRIDDLNREIDSKRLLLMDCNNKIDKINAEYIIELGRDIKSLMDDVAKLDDSITKYRKFKPIYLRVIPELITLTELQELDSLCDRLEDSLILYDKSLSCCKFLQPELDLTLFSFDDVTIPLEDYKKYKETILSLEETLQELYKKQDIIIKQLSEIKVCPTCGREMEV